MLLARYHGNTIICKNSFYDGRNMQKKRLIKFIKIMKVYPAVFPGVFPPLPHSVL